MAEDKEIYPKGLPHQTDDFSKNQKFKHDVFEAIQETALETTKQAFKDLGFKEKEGRAGEYGNGESYGKGTDSKEFNVKVTSRQNTKSYFEKVIYFGGKKAISEVTIGYEADKKAIELAYKTTEFSAFRGYHEKTSYAGAQLINDRSNFVVNSISDFKKDLKKIFKKYADKEIAYITSTKIGVEDKTEKSINSMVESNMSKNKLSFSDLFSSSFDEALEKVVNYVNESKKEEKEEKKEKVTKNSPEVVKANSPGNLLFDEKDEEKEKEEKVSEMTTAGSAAVAQTGGEAPGEKLGSVGQFKYAANPFGQKFEDTPYAKAKNKRATVKKTKNEGDTFWTTVDLEQGSGYVPKGMEHNYVMGQHDKKLKESTESVENKSQDSKIIKESLVKRKFVTLKENEEKGVNKRYIVTEQRSEEEQKERWKSLSLFETYNTIRNAEEVISEELLKECGHMEECSCGCNMDVEDVHGVSMEQGQEENEKEFMQRNDGAEEGDFVDGKEVIVVAKPNSLSNAMFKVFKEDYLNESKAFILDLNSGNLVYNPNFKTNVEYKVKKN